MSVLLEYDAVEISFHAVPVVHDINFSLKKGEVLGIVGESGSGKSTLLKAAMGILGKNGMVTKGDIWFEGKSIPDLSERELQSIRGEKIGMIFQDAGNSLCPIRTIGEQILESMCAHQKGTPAEIKERTLEMFEKLHFKDAERIWYSYPFELSGGMNQRVAIVAAMLLQPIILLADEPTSALDVTVQKQVIREMMTLKEIFQTAILLVSHDIGVVSAIADNMLVLKDGEIQEYGSTAHVLEKPQAEYTKELLSAVPRLRRI